MFFILELAPTIMKSKLSCLLFTFMYLSSYSQEVDVTNVFKITAIITHKPCNMQIMDHLLFLASSKLGVGWEEKNKKEKAIKNTLQSHKEKTYVFS